MNANKDEARRCAEIARKRLKSRDKEAAKKFLLKAKRLDPTIVIEDLEFLFKSRSRSSSGRSGSQERQATPRRSSESPEPRNTTSENIFTKSQAESVRKILACKDYYELFGLNKDCTDEEIRKSYKMLALKFHPDKNRAPGATEAFKKIGTAFNVLTDTERRRRYDQFGTEEEQMPRVTQVHRHGDAFFQYDTDVFTMFFNGGFPFSQVYRDHRHQPRSRESNRESNYFVYIQLIPLIILFVLSFFSNLFVKDPYFNLSRSNKYCIEHNTAAHKIPYYVKKTFEQDFTGNIAHLESQVEEEYVSNLRFRCYREKDYRDNLLFRARYYGDDLGYERATQLHMPNCERLAEMFGG